MVIERKRNNNNDSSQFIWSVCTTDGILLSHLYGYDVCKRKGNFFCKTLSVENSVAATKQGRI